MISSETKSELVNLLKVIGEGEREREHLRQVLYDQEGLNPESAFKLLDFMSKDFITSDDIFKYLLEDSSITPMSSYLLLKE